MTAPTPDPTPDPSVGTELIEILVHPEDAPDTARRLLAAAGDNFRAVTTVMGGFLVPAGIAAAAGLTGVEEEAAEAAAKPAAKRGNAKTDAG